MHASDEHTSSLAWSVGDESKSFFNISSKDEGYKTFFGRKLWIVLIN